MSYEIYFRDLEITNITTDRNFETVTTLTQRWRI